MPKIFNDVKVFAGDNFKPASDASIKNIFWENLPDIFFNVYTPAIVSLEIYLINHLEPII